MFEQLLGKLGIFLSYYLVTLPTSHNKAMAQ